MTDTPSAHPDHQDRPPGHHWHDADKVRDFVARMDRRADERRHQLDLLVKLIPHPTGYPLAVLDVGAGFGSVAASVLDAFPCATATLLDISAEMQRVGRERLAHYDGRYEYHTGDFDGGVLPPALAGPYDAVVSALAIHHLDPPHKRDLYHTIAQRLAPGGVFLQLDIIAAPTDDVQTLYWDLDDREHVERGEPPWDRTRIRHTELQLLEDHLGWLREAQLERVDCYWKRLDLALFGGRKAANQ